MTTNKNTTKNNQSTQDFDAEINDLLVKAKKINQDIDASSKGTREAMEDINARVDKSVATLEEIYSDLDKADKEAGDQLDKLILEEAVDLASEE